MHRSRFSARRAFSSFFRDLFFLLLVPDPRGRELLVGCLAAAGNLKLLPFADLLLDGCRRRHHQKPAAATAPTRRSPSAELLLLLLESALRVFFLCAWIGVGRREQQTEAGWRHRLVAPTGTGQFVLLPAS
jgi:hypothetical protein